MGHRSGQTTEHVHRWLAGVTRSTADGRGAEVGGEAYVERGATSLATIAEGGPSIFFRASLIPRVWKTNEKKDDDGPPNTFSSKKIPATLHYPLSGEGSYATLPRDPSTPKPSGRHGPLPPIPIPTAACLSKFKRPSKPATNACKGAPVPHTHEPWIIVLACPLRADTCMIRYLC